MFSNCTKLSYLDLSGLDTNKVETMDGMFFQAGYNVTTSFTLNADVLDVSSVITMKYMFYRAGYQASSWDIGNLENWDTSSVEDMSYMFCYAAVKTTSSFSLGNLNTKVVTINGKTYTAWDTSSVTDMSFMFYDSGASAEVWDIGEISNWNTSSVTNMASMFEMAGTFVKEVFDLGDLNTKVVTINGKTYTAWDVSSVTSMANLFSRAGRKAANSWYIGELSNWDTSSVTNMSSMFYQCSDLVDEFNIGNIGTWDTSKVTTMSRMFAYVGYSASKLYIGDLSTKTVTKEDGTTYIAWNTSSVTDMTKMFQYAAMRVLDFNIGNVGTWNTGKVTSMEGMFRGICGSGSYDGYSFYIGDLSNWDTSSVTNMANMFDGTGYNSKTFNIGSSLNWNTSKVTTMNGMFTNAGRWATDFTELDLSSFDVSKVTDMTKMFHETGVRSLKQIKLPYNISSTVTMTNVTSRTWYDATDNYKEYVSGTIPVGNAESHVLVNSLLRNITYELDGGTNPSGAPTTYQIGVGVTLPTPTKENCDFAGWYTTSDFSGEVITEISASETSDITLYAKWEDYDLVTTAFTSNSISQNGFDSYGSTVTQTSTYTVPEGMRIKNITSRFSLTLVDGNNNRSYSFYLRVYFKAGTYVSLVSQSGTLYYKTENGPKSAGNTSTFDFEDLGYDIGSITKIVMQASGAYATKNCSVVVNSYYQKSS